LTRIRWPTWRAFELTPGFRPSISATLEPVRLRGSRNAFRRIGNIARAAHYERRLATIETRQPESWAIEVGEGRSTP